MNEAIIAFASAIFGSFCGYVFAMFATRYVNQCAAVADFKRRLMEYIRKIEHDKGSGNSSLDAIQACMRHMNTEYLLCRAALNRRPTRRLAKLWNEFYREDDGSDLLEYWENDASDVEPKHSKALDRLHAVISFQIRIHE